MQCTGDSIVIVSIIIEQVNSGYKVLTKFKGSFILTLALTLIDSMVFLGIRFVEEEVKLTPSLRLKLFRIILETCNLVCKYTHIFSFSTNTPFVLLMSNPAV